MASCLSNRKNVYLQDKTQKRSHDVLVRHTFNNPYQAFRLEPGDVVSVRINHFQLTSSTDGAVTDPQPDPRSEKHPYLNGFRIDDSMNISLPVIGAVKLGGLTLEESERKIAQIADRFYSSPTVKVFLMNFKITVLGEVQQPGTFPVYNDKITIFEALGMAGDAGPYANREAVRVTRTRGGSSQLYHLDLTDENVLTTRDLYLQPNDIVLIKAQKRKKYTLNDSRGIVQAMSVFLSIGSIAIALNK